MARRLRHSKPGSTYHVILRGNNKQTIFVSKEDCYKLCSFIEDGIAKYNHRIIAFCFMKNHIHLAIQTSETSLSKIIHNLSFRYTQYFNWKHDKVGHLFQGRFKSILVDSNRYLKELVRYIHLNPVRAKLIDDPSRYFWSSHCSYLIEDIFPWVERDGILRHFGFTRSEAVPAYQKFIAAGIGKRETIDFRNGFAEGIVGDNDFIERMTVEINPIPIQTNFKLLLAHVCEFYEVKTEELRNGNRKCSHIRSVLSLLARDFEGVTIKELADYCKREPSALSKAASRLEIKTKSSPELAKEVKLLKRKWGQA